VFAVRCQALRTLAQHGRRHAIRLLPDCHAGWRGAAEALHQEAVKQFARRHGLSDERYRLELLEWLRGRLEDADLRIRMRPQHFRPVYGYVEGSDERHPALQQYGPVVLVLKPEVGLRASLTLGDSLDLAVAPQFPDPCFFPEPVLDPGLGAFPLTPRGNDPLAASELHEASPHPYAEVQVFGGIRLADVREVVCTMGYSPPRSTMEQLDPSGVDMATTPEMAP
jgi:hypothetical protein